MSLVLRPRGCAWDRGGPAGNGPGRSHRGGQLRVPGPDHSPAECLRWLQEPLRERQARTAALGGRAQGQER